MSHYQGLTTNEAKKRQVIYGRNEMETKKQDIYKILLSIVSEPIYLLLSGTSIIYFLLGERTDGLVMIGFVLFIIGIDVLQDIRTGNVLKTLKEITTPKIKVIRDGKEIELPGSELVPGDLILLSEGVKIPADGYLVEASGLCVDKKILTGESLGVWKKSKTGITYDGDSDFSEQIEEQEEYFKINHCYAGTLVTLGSGLVMIEKTGYATEYGRMAYSISETPKTDTPLQKQMRKLTKQCTAMAAVLFVLVGFITFLNLPEYTLAQRSIQSLLAGVVLALSMIPGEFPVILTVFFSMGALRLAKKKALIRHLPCIETLGAISVLCMDKTGTITKNKMKVEECSIIDRQEGKFCRVMSLACKEGTYDPVEQALLEYCNRLCRSCQNESAEISACGLHRKNHKLVMEYAFTNELKAMGQVWEDDGILTIAAKGCPETILSLCFLSKESEEYYHRKIMDCLEKGLRVIALADCTLPTEANIPESLTECRLFLRGVIGLSDPIREEIEDSIKNCYDAGIRVVMITGDHQLTASMVARKVGIHDSSRVITGDQITKMSEAELQHCVKECNLFARVLPLHKMRIVKALKDNGEVVAMTGDGVNDSPAQRLADIGVAMGKQGSEVCREAADLILLDDNFSTILDTVKDGRRIYQNILKTIGYVLSIHIPIALVSLAAPMLGIAPSALMLLPVHIVLLEMVMDPTCSIVLERQPPSDDIMKKPPRDPEEHLLDRRRLLRSVLQGMAIFLATFGIYYVLLTLSYPVEIARTAGFTSLVLANILLVAVNSSETDSILRIIKKLKSEKGIWGVNLITIIALYIMIYSPFHENLGFTPLSALLQIIVLMVTLISVLWYELVKLARKRRIKRCD